MSFGKQGVLQYLRKQIEKNEKNSNFNTFNRIFRAFQL